MLCGLLQLLGPALLCHTGAMAWGKGMGLDLGGNGHSHCSAQIHCSSPGSWRCWHQALDKAWLQDGEGDELKSWVVPLCHWQTQGDLQSTLGMQESLGEYCGGWAASSTAQESEEPGNLLSDFSCQPFMFVFLRSFCSLGKSDRNSC